MVFLARGRLAVTAAALGALVFAPAVLATNDLGHKAGSGSVVSFNLAVLTATIHDAWHFNNTNSIDPTDISPTHYHDTSGKLVRVSDAPYGDTGWYGRWYCNLWDSNRIYCYDGRVQINNTYGPYTNTEAESLVCEEVGHSVGLAHRSSTASSCMSQQFDETLLDSHDKGILNNKY